MMEELLVFTTVVEQSSLNKASKLLNLSQPALSRKIATLEEEWGVSLEKTRADPRRSGGLPICAGTAATSPQLPADRVPLQGSGAPHRHVGRQPDDDPNHVAAARDRAHGEVSGYRTEARHRQNP